jgi:hypothetical protein
MPPISLAAHNGNDKLAGTVDDAFTSHAAVPQGQQRSSSYARLHSDASLRPFAVQAQAVPLLAIE